jgi:hypothetical protein
MTKTAVSMFVLVAALAVNTPVSAQQVSDNEAYKIAREPMSMPTRSF